MRALKIAATGMEAQQMRVEVISNNIANMSTTAYQPRRAEFADLHYQMQSNPGSISSTTGTLLATGVQLGLGVRAASVTINNDQGSLQRTEGDLDIAIEGQGWLQIELPAGDTAYTRDGALKRSANGEIVTSEGFPLLDGITIPEDARDIAINANGEVFAYFQGQVQPQQLGAITLATFTNNKGLEAIGDNMFLESAASGAPIVGEPGVDGRGTLRQGYLESSAVDVVLEITELIEAQRGYEMNSKVISASDEMLGTATQIR